MRDKFAAALVSLTLILLLTASSANAQQGKKYAFLVGVETYDPAFLTRLQYAEDDAQALAEAFTGMGFDVTLMTRDAELPARRPNTAVKILTQLRQRLQGLRKEDTLVCGFSGHGVQFSARRTLADGTEESQFFCPEEADLSNPDSLVPLDRIYALLESCPAERKLLLVDACRNEVLSPVAKSAAEIELEPAGVVPRTNPKGMLALFSCTEGEKSYEFPELEHGVFCYYVLRYLNGEADRKYYFRDEASIQGLVAYAPVETRDFVFNRLSKDQFPEMFGRTTDWPLGQSFIVLTGTAPGEAHQVPLAGLSLRWCPPGTLDFAISRIDGIRGKVGSGTSGENIPKLLQRTVKVQNGFWMDARCVTRSQFKRVTGRDGESLPGDEIDPQSAVKVSWEDAMKFCEMLTRNERDAGRMSNGEEYTLPTLGQWQYALRAGASTRFPFGENASDWEAYAWPDVDHHAVAQKLPNRWGLYDMLGLSEEWCRDWVSRDAVPEGPDLSISKEQAARFRIPKEDSRIEEVHPLVGGVSSYAAEQDVDRFDEELLGTAIAGGSRDCPYFTFRIVRVRRFGAER